MYEGVQNCMSVIVFRILIQTSDLFHLGSQLYLDFLSNYLKFNIDMTTYCTPLGFTEFVYNYLVHIDTTFWQKEKKEEIWLSPITKNPSPTEI